MRAFFFGFRQNLEGEIVDFFGLGERALAAAARYFGVHVDEAAGVDEKVRGVHDAAAHQLGAVLVFHLQLVVGAAGHHAGFQAWNGVVVQGSTQRARRVDVHVLVVNLIEAHGRGPETSSRFQSAVLVIISHDEFGTLFLEVLQQVGAHVAHALHANALAGQALGAVGFFGSGFHAHVSAVGRDGRGVAGAAHALGQAGYVLGFHADVLHVLGGHVHVLGRDVLAVQVLHEAAELAQQGFGLQRLGVANDDGLAAAQVQARDGGLVGHAAAQAQHVVQGFHVGSVVPHAGAAQRGPKHRVMDADNGFEARLVVVAKHDLLVLVLGNLAENGFGSHDLGFNHWEWIERGGNLGMVGKSAA